jgi:hypothetical protein
MRHKCAGVHGIATDFTSNDALGQWLLRNVSTMHHICGTCKMGPASDALAWADSVVGSLPAAPETPEIAMALDGTTLRGSKK